MSYQQLSILYELQEIDVQIAKLQSQKKAIPIEIKRLDAKFLEDKNRFLEAQNQLKDMEQQVSQKSEVLEQSEQRLKKNRSQRSLITDSEKEYNALERQISNLEKKNANAEDEILELMLSIDDATEALEKGQAELNREETEYQKRCATLHDTDKQLTAQIKEQMLNRKTYYDKVDSALLKRYDNWRTLKGTFLLAPVSDNACGGCNITPRPQTINEIRKGEKIVTCESCGRILFYMPEDESVESDK